MDVKRQTAFTLIELLVVVAIISLLVSILLPSLRQAKELARTVVCASGLRHTSQAMLYYATENDDLILPSYWQNGQVVIDPACRQYYDEYYDNDGSSDGCASWEAGLYKKTIEDMKLWSCPSMWQTNRQYRPASYDDWLVEFSSCYGLNGETGWDGFHRQEDIANAWEEPFFADSIYCPTDGETFESYVIRRSLRNSYVQPNVVPRSVINFRHLEQANIIFYDQSYQAVRPEWADEHDWDYWINFDEWVQGAN